MANPGQPTISLGATGPAVRRLQRALRRTADHGVTVDGIFGPVTDRSLRSFQQDTGLVVDGIAGPQTWQALPDGGPMPLLSVGSTGEVVRRLQDVLTTGADQWGVSPQGVDGDFGEHTRASVMAFQKWADLSADGIVGDLTWSAPMHAAGATLESVVGIQFIVD